MRRPLRSRPRPSERFWIRAVRGVVCGILGACLSQLFVVPLVWIALDQLLDQDLLFWFGMVLNVAAAAAAGFCAVVSPFVARLLGCFGIALVPLCQCIGMGMLFADETTIKMVTCVFPLVFIALGGIAIWSARRIPVAPLKRRPREVGPQAGE